MLKPLEWMPSYDASFLVQYFASGVSEQNKEEIPIYKDKFTVGCYRRDASLLHYKTKLKVVKKTEISHRISVKFIKLA